MNTTDDLDKYFIPDQPTQEEPGFVQKAGRVAERYLQRGAESLFGLPGDVVQTVMGLSQMLPESLKTDKELNFAQYYAKKGLESLPTSAELRAMSAEKKPYLEPQTEMENIEDEIVSDFATLALPVKGKVPFARALGLSMAGNLGKEVVKDIGLSEGGQDATKLGLMFFLGMFGKGRGVQRHIQNLYKSSEDVVPKGAKFKYPTKVLDNVEKTLRKGTLNEAKQPVLKIIEDIRIKSPEGMMSVEEAVQFDKDINKAIGRAYNDKTLRGNLKQLKAAHSEAIDQYAKENPSFGEAWKEAKQAYQGIATSIDIQNYIKRNANLKNIANAGIILGLEEAALPGNVAIKLGSLGIGASTLYAAEVAKRIAKNPALRRYYANVVNASLSDNKGMLARNLEGLERVAKKEFENNPLPIFDISEEDEIEFED